MLDKVVALVTILGFAIAVDMWDDSKTHTGPHFS